MPPSEPPLSTPPAVGLIDRLKHTRREHLLTLFWEMVRFGWVGVFTVAVYAGEMWELKRLTAWPAWLSASLAYGPCLVINYVLHRTFTFRSDKPHSESGPRYLAIQLGGLGLNSGVLWFSVDHMRWAYLPAQVSVIVILALLSYVGQKLWSF